MVQMRMMMQTRYEKQSLRKIKSEDNKENERKIPADRIPVESDGVSSRESTHSNHQSDVENCGANNTTNTNIILAQYN